MFTFLVDVVRHLLFRLVLYYGLVEGQTPLGKPVYQSKLKERKQLDADKVCYNNSTLKILNLYLTIVRITA